MSVGAILTDQQIEKNDMFWTFSIHSLYSFIMLSLASFVLQFYNQVNRSQQRWEQFQCIAPDIHHSFLESRQKSDSQQRVLGKGTVRLPFKRDTNLWWGGGVYSLDLAKPSNSKAHRHLVRPWSERTTVERSQRLFRRQLTQSAGTVPVLQSAVPHASLPPTASC